MPMVNVDIEHSILQWMINQTKDSNVGQTVEDYLEELLVGKKKATFKQIEELSKKTHIPLGYFFFENTSC